MNTSKSQTAIPGRKLLITHYILTGLLVLDVLMSGLAFLAATITDVPQITATMTRLGYPLYLLPILALIKIGGAIVLLSKTILRQWAHVGFFFMFLLAFYSHLSAGDGLQGSMPALLAFVLNLLSYVVYRKLYVKS